MFKNKVCLFTFFFCVFAVKTADARQTLNILSTMGAISSSVISQFEKIYQVNVRIDFIGSKYEYEPKLLSSFRNYDVIVANERVLERLLLERHLRPLSEPIVASTANAFYPLELHSKLNSDGTAYVTLEADPLGIAYLKSSSTIKDQTVTVELLEKLLPRTAFLEFPLELAFLSHKINSAVVFHSSFVRYKKVIPDLEFVVPAGITYYDRIAAGVSGTTMQDTLAESFVRYLYENEDNIIVNNNYLSCKTLEFSGSKTINWILYENARK